MSLVVAQNVSKTFQDGEHKITILRDVNLNVAAGEHVAIVGASGSGKSTLLHILGGLDTPSSGAVFIDGNDIAKATDKQNARMRNQDIGFIYQFHHLLPEFSALENVAMPLLIRKINSDESYDRAADMLTQVGLNHRMSHTPGELSGGERHRAAIARALVTKPACILADEPTGNLDRHTAGEVFKLMLDLNHNAGASLIIVTHDPFLSKQTGRTLQLVDGMLIE